MTAEIRAELRDLERRGELVRAIPVNPRDRNRVLRPVYVAPEIWRGLEPPFQSEKDERTAECIRAVLSQFMVGYGVTVRVPPSKYNLAPLAWLDPPVRNIWAFRCRDCNPQVRILGQFAGSDLFVALVQRDKSECNLPEHYRAAMDACEKRWRALLLSFPPFRAARAQDYVSSAGVISD